MKIAFLISAGRFPCGILQELRAQLPQQSTDPLDERRKQSLAKLSLN